MGKINVNIKGNQQQNQNAFSSRNGYYHEPREVPRQMNENYDYPKSGYGRYYEPDSSERQKQFERQQNAARQKQFEQSQQPQPNYYNQRGQYPTSQPSSHEYFHPFQQFYAPQYQQRRPQQNQNQKPQSQSQKQTQSPPHSPHSQSSSPVTYDEIDQFIDLPQRNEGVELQAGGKQYSIASTQTFTKLDTIKGKLNDLLLKVNDIETTTKKEESESLNKSKNLLAQISGDIDRLQFTGLDAIDTSVLHSGKDDARNTRKKLNRDIEELQQHVQELHKIYGEISAKIAEHDQKQEQLNQNENESSTTTSISNDSSSETTEISSELLNHSPIPEEILATEIDNNDNAEGNLTPPESIEPTKIEIKRDDEQIDREESNETSNHKINETKEEILSTNEIKENEIEIKTEIKIENEIIVNSSEEKVQEEEVKEIDHPSDTVDMTEWVIEESSPTQLNDNTNDNKNNIEEILTLKKLLNEKDELIEQLKLQLYEKDNLLQQFQQKSSSSSSSSSIFVHAS